MADLYVHSSAETGTSSASMLCSARYQGIAAMRLASHLLKKYGSDQSTQEHSRVGCVFGQSFQELRMASQ